jgi:L-histidine N-alpha-methyltransferase
VKSPRLIQIAHEDPQAIRAELLAGLMAPKATIAPKYLYDALGSRLFSAITELPEYYPTRTEAAIFVREMNGMARAIGPVSTLVDLGAGNCEKAARLFETFRVQRYVAVDISVNYLRDSLACLQREHPEMDMLGVGLDFSASLALPTEIGDGPRCLFYPAPASATSAPPRPWPFCARPMPPPGRRAVDRRRPGQAGRHPRTRL